MAVEKGSEQHFSRATLLVMAALVALIAISASLLFITSGFVVSGLIMASGAVIAGLLVRRVAGATAMWLCFGLAVLAFSAGVLLQLMMNSIA